MGPTTPQVTGSKQQAWIRANNPDRPKTGVTVVPMFECKADIQEPAPKTTAPNSKPLPKRKVRVPTGKRSMVKAKSLHARPRPRKQKIAITKIPTAIPKNNGAGRLLLWAEKLLASHPKEAFAHASISDISQQALEFRQKQWSQYKSLAEYKCRNWLRELQQLKQPTQVWLVKTGTSITEPKALCDVNVLHIPLHGANYVMTCSDRKVMPIQTTLHLCFIDPTVMQETVMCNSLAELLNQLENIGCITISSFDQWNRKPDEFCIGLTSSDPKKIKTVVTRCQGKWGRLLTPDNKDWEWAGSGKCVARGIFQKTSHQDQTDFPVAIDQPELDAAIVARAIINHRDSRKPLHEPLLDMIKEARKTDGIPSFSSSLPQALSDVDNDQKSLETALGRPGDPALPDGKSDE